MHAIDLTRSLNQVLRNHLAMSSQLFFHEIIARTWKADHEVARDIVVRYDTEFSADIARLFALLDHMLTEGYPLHTQPRDPLHSDVIAVVGCTPDEMLARDHQLLACAQPLLRTSIELCQQHTDSRAADMLHEGIATRARLIDWIDARRQLADAASTRPRRLSAPLEEPQKSAWARINELIVYTLAVIDQTTCHTVVLTHAGDEDSALATWRRSWQTMVDLGALVTKLALAGWSIDTIGASNANPSLFPRVSARAEEVTALDTSAFTAAADRAEKALDSTLPLKAESLHKGVTRLNDTLDACSAGKVPKNAMNYPSLPQHLDKYRYAGAGT